MHIRLRMLMQVNVMESYSSGLTAVKLLLHLTIISNYFKLFQIHAIPFRLGDCKTLQDKLILI